MGSNIRQITFWSYLISSIILITLTIVFLLINKDIAVLMIIIALFLSIVAYLLGVKWSHLAKALKKLSRYFMGIELILIVISVFV